MQPCGNCSSVRSEVQEANVWGGEWPKRVPGVFYFYYFPSPVTPHYDPIPYTYLCLFYLFIYLLLSLTLDPASPSPHHRPNTSPKILPFPPPPHRLRHRGLVILVVGPTIIIYYNISVCVGWTFHCDCTRFPRKTITLFITIIYCNILYARVFG